MKIVTTLAVIAALAPSGTSASCSRTERERSRSGFRSRIRPSTGGGGFVVGIQVDPTTAEKYRELLAKTKWRAFDEMVKISIYDANGDSPKLLSTTWGGTNSKQGFGPRGGANGVPALGEQIELWLHYPVCVTPETLADAK